MKNKPKHIHTEIRRDQIKSVQNVKRGMGRVLLVETKDGKSYKFLTKKQDIDLWMKELEV